MITPEALLNKNKTELVDFSFVPSELVNLLAQIGFVATGKCFYSKADDIFNGIVSVRPKDHNALIGQSAAKIFSGKLKEANDILFGIIFEDPNNDMAKSYLALNLYLAQVYPTAKQFAEEVIKSNTDKEATALATGVLEKIKELNLK